MRDYGLIAQNERRTRFVLYIPIQKSFRINQMDLNTNSVRHQTHSSLIWIIRSKQSKMRGHSITLFILSLYHAKSYAESNYGNVLMGSVGSVGEEQNRDHLLLAPTIVDKFHQWMDEHGKVYDGFEEKYERMKIWLSNNGEFGKL